MTASEQSIKLATIAATAAGEKLATDITVIDVSEQLVITDCFVIASGDNDRQVSAIVDEIEDKLREAGEKPIRKEGVRESRWALLDYGAIVVHVQRVQEREFYALDRLWWDCPLIPVAGIDTPQRPESWAEDVNVRAVETLDEIPLADTELEMDKL